LKISAKYSRADSLATSYNFGLSRRERAGWLRTVARSRHDSAFAMMVTRRIQLRPEGYSKGRNEGNPVCC
jgi:hypothetical protein